MSRKQTTGKRSKAALQAKAALHAVKYEPVWVQGRLIRVPPPPLSAFTIPAFCAAFDMSERYYYLLRERGEGPKEMRMGSRVLISIDAVAKWQTAREKATA